MGARIPPTRLWDDHPGMDPQFFESVHADLWNERACLGEWGSYCDHPEDCGSCRAVAEGQCPLCLRPLDREGFCPSGGFRWRFSRVGERRKLECIIGNKDAELVAMMAG